MKDFFDARTIAAMFNVPLELIDMEFAAELDAVHAINAHLPFADPIELVDDVRAAWWRGERS